jgi:hypothetical protein
VQTQDVVEEDHVDKDKEETQDAIPADVEMNDLVQNLIKKSLQFDVLLE